MRFKNKYQVIWATNLDKSIFDLLRLYTFGLLDIIFHLSNVGLTFVTLELRNCGT